MTVNKQNLTVVMRAGLSSRLVLAALPPAGMVKKRGKDLAAPQRMRAMRCWMR